MILRRSGTDDGFALLEVLVSMTLLAVGLVAVLTGVLTSLDVQRDTALRYRAGLILRDKLAETLLVTYSGETVRGRSDDGRFQWTIIGTPWNDGSKEAQESDNASTRLYEVVVEVGWEADGAERRISATQLLGVALDAEVSP